LALQAAARETRRPFALSKPAQAGSEPQRSACGAQRISHTPALLGATLARSRRLQALFLSFEA